MIRKRINRPGTLIGIALLLSVSAACEHSSATSPCDPIDPVLAESSFVLVTDPAPGARVSSPMRVRGCSRTFESNVVWELHARDGRILASGHTTGGGVSGAGTFTFSVVFTMDKPQPGHLNVFEIDASDGEGFPPGRAVIPLILLIAVPFYRLSASG